MNVRVSRREFIGKGSAVTAAVLAGAPRIAPQGSDTLKVGVIGCGKRGTGAMKECLKASENVRIIALADLFKDRLDASRQRLDEHKEKGFEVEDKNCFLGFDAYKKVLDLPIDMVLLTTPPGFRPVHFEAAVEAGKHVFLEKPVAVDPTGIRSVFASGKKAGEKGLSVVAGTQLRHQKDRLDTIGKIHEGGIGRIVAARAFWNGAGVGVHERQAGWTDMEYQLRNWYYYEWLCGDHIVEQHIHNLDVINWAIKSPPVKAVAVGGRQVRNDPKRHGNVWDHFAVDFEYPNGAHLLSMCRHWKGCPGDVSETVVGTKGMSNCHDSITDHDGKTLWKTGKEPQDPFVQEQANLIESIRAKKPINEAEQVAISTLTAIMGRETAYTGKVVTWDEMMKSDLDLTPKDLRLDAPAPMRPVPVPGRPRKI